MYLPKSFDGPDSHRMGYVPSPKDDRDLKGLRKYMAPEVQPRAGAYFKPLMLPPRLWKLNLPSVLNQGDTPKCTSRAAAHMIDADPIAHNFGDKWADDFYDMEKEIDGLPPGSQGSTPRALAKTLQRLKLIDRYAWTRSLAEARTWLLTKGPMTIGSIWTRNMSKPKDGWVTPFGAVDGLHEVAILGWIPRRAGHIFFDEVILPNSWGPEWYGFYSQDFAVSLPGYFRIQAWGLWWLMLAAGELMTTVEIPSV